jgi:transcriptional regulator with XRE-family HTH domain
MIMNDTSKNFGRLIKQRRQFTKLTLHELSDASGVSPSHLGRIEKGERFPSAAILRRIARPLGLSEGEIFTLAGYLTPTVSSNIKSESVPVENRLDPYVVQILSKEPVEVQRAVVEMLSVVKSVATRITPSVNIEKVRLAR